MTESRALRSVCLSQTGFSLSPLARAVRTYSSPLDLQQAGAEDARQYRRHAQTQRERRQNQMIESTAAGNRRPAQLNRKQIISSGPSQKFGSERPSRENNRAPTVDPDCRSTAARNASGNEMSTAQRSWRRA